MQNKIKHPNSPLHNKVATIILAGGQGTRLHPLTIHRCKPSVSFAGRYRLIDIPISNSLNSHIFQIYVISQYFASNLQQHLSATYHFDAFHPGQLEMLCPEETPQGKNWFKGTADAIRQSWHNLSKANVDYFLILSGDQLYNMDLAKMLIFAESTQADLVIASLPVKEAEAKRMGLLQMNERCEVIDFFEKPTQAEVLKKFVYQKQRPTPHYLGSMGIYIFKKQALADLLSEQGDDFGKNLIPIQVKRGNTFAFVYDGYWEDIGTIESYYTANLALTERKYCLNMYDDDHPIYTTPCHLPSPMIKDTRIKNSLISQGCVIEAQEISHSILGVRSYVQSGTVITNSVLLGDLSENQDCTYQKGMIQPFCIGKDCLINKCIIDENTQIGHNVTLMNQNHLSTYDGDGIYIRDGIIVVTSGATIPDGFTL